jgi:hypothetical protein
MGAGIAASPHCAERRICRSSAATTQGTVSASPCSPAQASLPIRRRSRERSLSPSRVRHPKARFSFGVRPVRRPLRPMFRGPSWDDPLSRPALLPLPKQVKPRRAIGRSSLPAPLPDWLRLRSEDLCQAPVGGDRFFHRLPRLPAASGSPARRGLPSRSLSDNGRPSRFGEARNGCSALLITWISGTTADSSWPFSRRRTGPARGCRCAPPALPPFRVRIPASGP